MKDRMIRFILSAPFATMLILCGIYFIEKHCVEIMRELYEIEARVSRVETEIKRNIYRCDKILEGGVGG